MNNNMYQNEQPFDINKIKRTTQAIKQRKKTKAPEQFGVNPNAINSLQVGAPQGLGLTSGLQQQMINDLRNQQEMNEQSQSQGIDLSNIPDDQRAFLKRLGQIESSGNYFAKPNKYGYEGMYQFRYRPGSDGYTFANKLGISWDEYRRNPQAQDKLMLYALNEYDRRLRSAGLPVNNFTRWLVHNQGLGGTKAILSGRVSPKIQRNISTNIPKGMAPTAQNYLAYWRKKWGY
jgi:hypothetical protein